ncbi:MAG: peroxiredoxin-like family protein [Verrucomicrobia bacterium]|nr:peroxiredoxin-like family protein [Verrucomicrobiota bacterium]
MTTSSSLRPRLFVSLSTSIPLLSALLAFAPFASPAARAATPTIAASAPNARPLAVGDLAPDARVRTSDGTELSLAAVLAEKPTVLVFYRGGWCPYCNRQLAELAAFEARFLELGLQIVALSTDAPAGLAPTAAKDKVAYRLLSDRAMSAASAYGVAFRVDAATVEKYRGFKIDLAPIPGEPDARWLPVPTVWVIGRDRVIRFVASDPDFKVRLPAAQLLEAARQALAAPAK